MANVTPETIGATPVAPANTGAPAVSAQSLGASPVKAAAPITPASIGATPYQQTSAQKAFTSVADKTFGTMSSTWNDGVTPMKLSDVGILGSKGSQEFGQNVEDAYKQGIGGAINDFMDDVHQSKFVTGQGALSKNIATGGEVALKAANILFSPISSTFKAAEAVPVLGYAAKGINSVFSGIGAGSGEAAVQGLNALPVSPETKANLEPVVRDSATLISQLVLGKATGDVMGKLNDNTHTIMNGIKDGLQVKDQINNDVSDISTGKEPRSTQPVTRETPPVEAKPAEAAPVDTKTATEPTATPESLKTEFTTGNTANTMATYDKYIQSGDYKADDVYSDQATKTFKPDIAKQVISDAKNNLIRLGQPELAGKLEAALDPNKLTPDVMKDTALKVIDENMPASKAPAPAKTTTGSTINVRTAKSAADLSQNMAEKGFESLPEEEKAKYSPTTKAEQISKVSDLMTNKMDDARAMIRGEKPVPTDIKGQVLFNAMEKFATDNGDHELMRDLVRSPIASELSRAAQTLGSHGFNDNPHSAVEAIREVTQAREANYLKRTGQAVEKAKRDTVAKDRSSLNSELKKAVSKRPTWEQLVETITCKA